VGYNQANLFVGKERDAPELVGRGPVEVDGFVGHAMQLVGKLLGSALILALKYNLLQILFPSLIIQAMLSKKPTAANE
jgi:hypothetical protein